MWVSLLNRLDAGRHPDGLVVAPQLDKVQHHRLVQTVLRKRRKTVN